MNWRIFVANAAKKQLSKTPWQDRAKIQLAIQAIAEDPFSGDIQKLAGKQNTWRRRVGSCRIFYKLETALQIIYILEVKRRTSNTY